MQSDYWKDAERAADQFRNIEPAVLAAMIKDEEKIIAAASRAKDAARGSDRQEWLRHHLAARNATARQDGMEQRMAIDFGTARGWRLSPSTFACAPSPSVSSTMAASANCSVVAAGTPT